MAQKDMPRDFALLCDYFWRLDYPETPKDGLLHMSDVCRARAREVFELLDLDRLYDEAERMGVRRKKRS